MATPIIQSVGTMSGAGTAGQGRNDLVISETVNLSDTEAANSGATYLWTFEDIPIGSSTPLVDPATDTPYFVPDIAGSYRIKCEVNGLDSSIEVLAVPLTNTGSRIPSFEEETSYDASGNIKGWHEAIDDFMREVDTQLGGASTDEKVGVTSNDTTPDYLLNKIAAGTNVAINELNDGGDEDLEISVASAAPSGSASGDLGGTYPGPSVAAITTTTGPQKLTVGAVADGEYLKRSGTDLIGDTPAGGTTAEALGTTGSDVDVGSAAPPTTGQVLKATSPTAATWQDESGGASQLLAAAQGDFIEAKMSADQSGISAADVAVLFNTAVRSSGITVDSSGKFSTLRAGRLYFMLADSHVACTSATRLPFNWYDLTNSVDLGTPGTAVAPDTSSVVGYPRNAMAVIRPTEDIEVEVRTSAAPAAGTCTITADNGWSEHSSSAIIMEIGAVQAEVSGGLEYLDTITVATDTTSISFGASGDGIHQYDMDGDVDDTYVIDFYLPAVTAGCSHTIRPNGATADQASARHFAGSSSGDASYTDLHISTTGSSGRLFAGTIEFQAKSGRPRTYTARSFQGQSPESSSNVWISSFAGSWDNDADNVISFDVVASVANQIKAGAVFKLYRRTTQNIRADSADSFERHITAAADEGTSTQTITLGCPNYGGSAVAMSMKAEDATTAGTLVANLKIGGSTVLTATLDTTNTTNHRVVEQIGTHTFQPTDELTVDIVGDASYTNAAAGVTGLTLNITLINSTLFVQPANGVVGETILSSASTTISVPGLDGDVHGSYEIEWHLLLDSGSTHTITMEPNGVNTNLFGAYHGSFNTPTAQTTWQLAVKSAATDRQLVGRARLMAKRTADGVAVRRTLIAENASTYTDSPYNTFQGFYGFWTNTADNLISLDVVNSIASGFLAGSRVTVKKA